MARPIPKKLLIHNVTHKYEPTKDSWGNIIYGKTQAITRVRIEPTTKRVMSKDNVEIQLIGLLFYDMINSSPIGIDFKLEDAIILGTTNYIVQDIEPLFDESGLHHLEVGLV